MNNWTARLQRAGFSEGERTQEVQELESHFRRNLARAPAITLVSLRRDDK